MENQVILLKTYIWSDDIEKYVLKLLKEVKECKNDFFILLHDEYNEVNKKIASDEIRNHVLSFTSQDVKELYYNNYVDMYFRSHLSHFWFYKKYPNYSYYWILEYDTRIVGNSKIFWNYTGQEDFISPSGIYNYPKDGIFYNHYENRLKNIDRFTNHNENIYWTYIQFMRCSIKFLNYMDSKLDEGENGQDETIIGTMVISGNFNYSDLSKYIKGNWYGSSTQDIVDYNKSEWNKYNELHENDENEVFIFHPVK